ncbi:hypothetical protein H6762_00895 [Candidatus Nomurabacteria bacterium]|uniref:Flavodoxin domain-containing protein n=1 Tax=Candidatus Dojkabacteria bacterium TaxID=2099670 RepID=A0A955I0V8_9BACT|nr:hypothetical protein [Candidatus Dojkabacteria bacterium]MCB9789534.1 hypothetical protein [Candidatus Nomurabacteria bacterium]
MEKNILLYKTEWGATQKYAGWIAEEEPSVKLFDIRKFDWDTIANYYKVVIGSRTYMGRIEAIDTIIPKWNLLKDHPVYLFSVGMIPPNDPESIRSFEMIPGEIRKQIAGYTKLMGRLDQDQLNLFQRVFVNFLKPEVMDSMDKRSIEPIVSFLKGVEWNYENSLRYVTTEV